MQVLYVTTPGGPEATAVLRDLFRLEPDLEVTAIDGAPAALAEIRLTRRYRAVFTSPSVPHNEVLALIASLRVERTPIGILAIITEPDQAFQVPTLMAGADDVLVWRGEQLVGLENAVHYLHKRDEAKGDDRATPARRQRKDKETDRLVHEVRDATTALATLRAENERLREVQAFEKALRDRDREELTALSRELAVERERLSVLEATLRHTEDHARTQIEALTETHDTERREHETEVVLAADRLHQVAHDTQNLQARLEHLLEEGLAERDRLTENGLIGHAVFARNGRLVRCSETFALMLGYAGAAHAVKSSRGRPFPGTPDHARIVELLDQGAGVQRFESTARNLEGRSVRVLTSAIRMPESRPAAAGEDIERLFVDLSDRAALEAELRLARRLESAGRLAAEMAPEIEAAFAHVEKNGGPEAAAHLDRAMLLVRQLIAFSRRQAKPAGLLSLNDAIVRLQNVMRQVAGEGIDLQLRLGAVESVIAGEEEIEQLLLEFVGSAAGSLPYGGGLTVTTDSVPEPESKEEFVLRTSLTAVAAGYGVLSVTPSSTLARLVARCGGVVRTSDDPGHTSTLHVYLPC